MSRVVCVGVYLCCAVFVFRKARFRRVVHSRQLCRVSLWSLMFMCVSDVCLFVLFYVGMMQPWGPITPGFQQHKRSFSSCPKLPDRCLGRTPRLLKGLLLACLFALFFHVAFFCCVRLFTSVCFVAFACFLLCLCYCLCVYLCVCVAAD